MSRRTPQRRATPPHRRRGRSAAWRWGVIAVVALVALVLLRPLLALAVRSAADGDRGVAGVLGVVPWLLAVLGVVLVRVARSGWTLYVGLWLLLLSAPGLSRRGSGRVEEALDTQAPGYVEGWLVGMALVVVPLTAWYLWARATGRLRS